MLTTNKIMTPEVFTVTQETSIFGAYNLMFEKRIRHLPVTNEQG